MCIRDSIYVYWDGEKVIVSQEPLSNAGNLITSFHIAETYNWTVTVDGIYLGNEVNPVDNTIVSDGYATIISS